MSGTTYQRYLQQQQALSSSVGADEGRLYQDYHNEQTAKATQLVSKKMTDVSKAIGLRQEAETKIQTAAELGTAGLVAIESGKRAAKSGYKTYQAYRARQASTETGNPEVKVGEPEHIPSSTPATESKGTYSRLRDDEDVGSAGESRGGEVEMTREHETEMRDMRGDRVGTEVGEEPPHAAASEGPRELHGDAEMKDSGIPEREHPSDMADHVEGGGEGAGEEVGERAGEEVGEHAAEGVGEVVATEGAELAGREGLGMMVAQAVPFVGEAVDLAMLGYGIYEGVEALKGAKSAEEAASAEKTAPPSTYGRSAPSLNDVVAVPVFDTTVDHSSGHTTSF